MNRTTLIVAAGTMLCSSLVFAQEDRMAQMQTIAASLGVRCEYCHSAPRGSGQAEPKKDIARGMMAMTLDLNAKIAAVTGKPPSELTRVACITCHRGVPIPTQLNELVTRSVLQKGSAAAVDQFRDLREHFYGHQAYDFSEDTLINVANQISQARPADAIALLKLNLEYYPKSSRSYVAMAFANTRQLDDTAAMANLEKALEIDPDNGSIQGRLEQLKSYHRRR
jgi:tetratricopeptide (TPR) repeat protein